MQIVHTNVFVTDKIIMFALFRLMRAQSQKYGIDPYWQISIENIDIIVDLETK